MSCGVQQSEDEELRVRRQDEVEALQAMYGEELIYDQELDGDAGIRIILKLSKALDTTIVDVAYSLELRFELGEGYPLQPPRCEAQCSSLKRAEHEELTACIKQLLDEYAGRECVFDLVQEVEEKAREIIEREPRVHPSGKEEEEEKEGENVARERCLVQLDHMRDEVRYCKTVAKWAAELSLSGCMLVHPRLIFIVLCGRACDISAYLHLHRTQQGMVLCGAQFRGTTQKCHILIDIDSHGRRCKERLLTLLERCPDPTVPASASSTFFEVCRFESLADLQTAAEPLGLSPYLPVR